MRERGNLERQNKSLKKRRKSVSRGIFGDATYVVCMALTLSVLSFGIGLIDPIDTQASIGQDILKLNIGDVEQIALFDETKLKEASAKIEEVETRINIQSDQQVANVLIEKDSESVVKIMGELKEVISTTPPVPAGLVQSGEVVEVSNEAPGESVGPSTDISALEPTGPALEPIEEAAQEVVEEVAVSSTPGPLLDGSSVDTNYHGHSIEITGQNRKDLESLVFHEAGAEGFIGASLVAQAIRDQMDMSGIKSARSIKSKFGYSGAINGSTNDVAREAVNYIFDQGGMAVQHRIIYFYAPRSCKSRFHESQKFIVEYKGHRVFDKR